MTSTELLLWLDAAKDAARCGAVVLEQWRSRFHVREKSRFDLVTEADLGSQKAIYDHLHQRFPDHAFLGEEDGGKASPPGADAPPTWIIDPLDGTTNYVHDCPMYCVSIGLQVAGELLVGVVYDPSREEMFAAAKGQGGFLNGKPLQPSAASSLGEALLASGFPPDLRGQEKALAWWRHFSLRAQSLRRTGSTALNIAYVAAGRFDGYFGFGNHAWDVAGGTVLVREAGGTVTNIDGSTYDWHTPDALASNGPLHPMLLEELRGGASGE
jgi:myo-inositol-1(or 4)-monophosphatase